MFCNICSFYESDSTMIEYSCGHTFHRRCIMPNSMSLIAPRCKVCIDGVYNECNSDNDIDCNACNSGEKAPRIRSESDYSDLWDEVNEYRDISATCVGFMCILSMVFIVLLIKSG